MLPPWHEAHLRSCDSPGHVEAAIGVEAIVAVDGIGGWRNELDKFWRS